METKTFAANPCLGHEPKVRVVTKTNTAMDHMFCFLFLHLKTSDVELAVGCVSVFGGL
jgi:hypothetical protein